MRFVTYVLAKKSTCESEKENENETRTMSTHTHSHSSLVTQKGLRHLYSLVCVCN